MISLMYANDEILIPSFRYPTKRERMNGLALQLPLRNEMTAGLPSILLIDDEPVNIEILGSMIEEKGYQCDKVSSGFEALSLIYERFELAKQGEEKMYKLLLLDFSMPEMDGPQTASIIRDYFKVNNSD
mmetsp:Transcript_1166/g.1539  ORF Transcript_1166/g.1539 Transcript_1166/m.1539 type:complete len:129 (-) Transcript_1166:43-429(-)|eukprot:CAMPEP_0185588978 /NCGR_PEP_ID=MMETSP0434-20130131/55140_1 /TAXON_ID=626734 ORGANISM="Favella taraikaensis, Strain Fe Narragansett Bay" /NCGR_SAMPLE_ID=MMETSP0434 /ASSEMBLY_ACC=CAM_ASM_000379 /LENGTH=128 /DNA_ID=CAMNT_0028211999 /DNA_START=327 /DNA_END=713 /DNA_ORIENTATION=+